MNTKGSIIWFTVINSSYIDFTLNFLESCRRSSIIFHLHVFCIDEVSFNTMRTLSMVSAILLKDVLVEKTYSSKLSEFGSIPFQEICFSRLLLTQYLFKNYPDKSVGLIDMDIVLFKDVDAIFSEALLKYPDISIFAQCDEEKLCSDARHCKNLCNGLMVLRNTPDVYALCNFEQSELVWAYDDQFFFNTKLKDLSISTITFPNDVFVNGTLAGIREHTPISLPPSIAALHFNWVLGHKKKEAMQEQGLWFI